MPDLGERLEPPLRATNILNDTQLFPPRSTAPLALKGKVQLIVVLLRYLSLGERSKPIADLEERFPSRYVPPKA
jgi:hypothetical protein